MNHAFLKYVTSLVGVSLLTIGCSSAVEESASTTEEALTQIGSSQTKRYVGSFDAAGASFTVEVELTLPKAAIGYQQMDSSKWLRSGRETCRVFNEWVSGSATTRVRDAHGAVVTERTERTGVQAVEQLDTSACPNGLLRHPEVRRELPATVEAMGVGFEADGQTVHVPRGYFTPNLVTFDAKAAFTPLGASRLEDKSVPGTNASVFKTDRGWLSVALPEELTFEVGVDPHVSAHGLYRETIEVTLRSQ